MMKNALVSLVCLVIVFVSIGIAGTKVTKLKDNNPETLQRELVDVYRSIPMIISKRITVTSPATTYTDTIPIKYNSPDDYIVMITEASNTSLDIWVENLSGNVYKFHRDATGTETYNVLIVPVGVWGR